MIRGGKRRTVDLPPGLLDRIHRRARVLDLPGGYRRAESANIVIERALDLEDVARAGILAPHPQCWKHEGTFETFSTFEELIAHVRAEHPGVIKGSWRK